MLLSYDFESQSKENQLNTKILSWLLKTSIEGERFFYHDYPVNQMGGVQNSLPSLMESSHQLNDESDIEAYIERLSKFDTKFKQVLEGLKLREEKGIVPPSFIIDRVISEMAGFNGTKERNEIELEPKNTDPVQANVLYNNFSSKIEKMEGLTSEQIDHYNLRVEEEIRNTVFPAYQSIIDYMATLKSKTNRDAGVWKLPDGDAYYQYQLLNSTTTDYTAEEIHQIGLKEVARIEKEMWDILHQEGYNDSTKTLGVTIQELNTEERFLFPDGIEGRKQILEGYEKLLKEIDLLVDDVFDVRPKAGLEVQRVPEFREEGSAGAYYYPPTRDGSRGGIFYANLRDVKETAKFDMKTLAVHEGIPGHHFQVAIQGELENVPIFRTFGLFSAFTEGWALYAEQLAWEMGFYKDDPFGNLGRLQAEMFRAVRLVVDSGIHYKRWTREEAIEYMVEKTGMSTSEVTTEIERYIVWPGQACSYKIGMMKILELREKAKNELGDQFDLKKFHNVVLKNGAVPLRILEEIINDYIKAEQKL